MREHSCVHLALSVVRQCDESQYAYIGIGTGITNALCAQTLPVPCNSLSLQFNVDGLPLFKSSPVTLWPILCIIMELPVREPFVVALHCGSEKPSSAAEFLRDFVAELGHLLDSGLILGDTHFDVRIHSFVCDAPARAFLKNIKSHSGYSSCEKCTEQGIYSGKVIFPLSDAPPRSDESFARGDDEEHHNGISPLLALRIGCVSQFGLDYMHLLCLGVVRRLLLYWKGPTGPKHVQIGSYAVATLSDRLMSLAEYVPTELARRPRSVKELLRWKAVEFRQFLLYSGPVVLKGVISEKLYQHFMLLVVASIILVSPMLSEHFCDYAGELLKLFVQQAADLYGNEILVYNVHNLIHLAADVKRLGALDNFSSFPFENRLGQLKKMVRKPQSPVQQILSRLQERQLFLNQHVTNTEKLGKEHFDGPLLMGMTGVEQFARLQTGSLSVSVSRGNNCILTRANKPAIVRNIVSVKDAIYLLCEQFQDVSDAFSSPLLSSSIGIVLVSKKLSPLFAVPVSEVLRKCICFPDFETDLMWVFPLLH